MAVNPLWTSPPQWVDSNGNPYSGAKLFFYAAGSSTKQNVFTDATGSVAAPNFVTLNAAGYAATAGGVSFVPFGTVGQTYKIGLALPTESDPPSAFLWTADNIAPIANSLTAFSEWVSGPTPTYVSATSFTLVGDQTSVFTVGRRVKVTDSGGTKYGTIASSVFGALTTITLDSASDALATPTSAVSYGLLNPVNTSIPWSKNTLIDAAGDGLIGSAADTLVRATLIYIKLINGLTYDNGTDATNDLNINTGGAMDATGARWMRLATALGKQSDVAWAVGGTTGAPAGGLDLIGSAGNNDFYIWLITRSDTEVVDALFSLSSTAPTMPANYDFKRLIGWFKRVGGTIVSFTTYETEGGGIEMLWNTPTLDVNLAATLTSTRRTDAVKVPLNFSVCSFISVIVTDGSVPNYAIVYCPDQSDISPISTMHTISTQAVAIPHAQQVSVRTSAAGLIASRCITATMDQYSVVTLGFTWARRN